MPHMPIEERAQHAPYIVQAGKIAIAGTVATGTVAIPEYLTTDLVFLSNNEAAETNVLTYVVSTATPPVMTVTRNVAAGGQTGVANAASIQYMVIRMWP